MPVSNIVPVGLRRTADNAIGIRTSKMIDYPSHTSTALICLIRAVHRCTTQLVAHGKWNYCVRIVVKVANFEINRGRTSLI